MVRKTTKSTGRISKPKRNKRRTSRMIGDSEEEVEDLKVQVKEVEKEDTTEEKKENEDVEKEVDEDEVNMEDSKEKKKEMVKEAEKDDEEMFKKKKKVVKKEIEEDKKFQLGNSNKYVNIRMFKGKRYVDIREYYTAKGELLPGKKGISLNDENWKSFLEQIEEIKDMFER
ncbi:hypothetical protein SNEBB_011360 [Seison nebaliae]|nr:hypothetical protein SNEBB_011360 [Seison nebaliae]